MVEFAKCTLERVVLGGRFLGHVMCANQISSIKLKVMKNYFISCTKDWYKYITVICMKNN